MVSSGCSQAARAPLERLINHWADCLLDGREIPVPLLCRGELLEQARALGLGLQRGCR